MPVDDLGAPVPVTRTERVVCLVPSLTEALASVRPEALVGVTEWCTHPAELTATRVRGTKNPDLAAIRRLAPDLVVANQEENRELDVRRLREAGIPVHVTRIRTLDEALSSIERLFAEVLRWPEPEWLGEARRVWAAPPSLLGPRVAVAVWRDPWMWVGQDTFAGDLLRRLGCQLPLDAVGERYPAIAPDEVDDLGLDAVLLPDEPYVFTPEDGPEMFPCTPSVLVGGRLLTWYGPSMTTARRHLEDALRAVAADAPD